MLEAVLCSIVVASSIGHEPYGRCTETLQAQVHLLALDALRCSIVVLSKPWGLKSRRQIIGKLIRSHRQVIRRDKNITIL